MKNLAFLFALIFLIGCTSQSTPSENQEVAAIKPEKNDDGEWDIDVMDSQWNYFLNGIARPMSSYSESYLKTKNAFLVSEWNSYYFSGRYRNVIESSIDYNSNENYGLKFEYKLYQVFAFVKWKYGLKMNGLSGVDSVR